MKFCYMVIAIVLSTSVATAKETKPSAKSEGIFNFKNTEITDVIAAYAKMSGERFVIDPAVRGKITILNSQR